MSEPSNHSRPLRGGTPASPPASATGAKLAARGLAHDTDTQLLARIARGDREAFSRFYDRYAGLLHSTVVRILADSAEASQVLQDVFVDIWDQAGAFNPAEGRPFQWALSVTRQRSIQRLRVLQRRYRFPEENLHGLEGAAGSWAGGPGDVFTPDQAALIRAAVVTLPLEQRQAIELVFLGGLTPAEIAATLQQPAATVKARIRRGLLRLRESLRGLL